MYKLSIIVSSCKYVSFVDGLVMSCHQHYLVCVPLEPTKAANQEQRRCQKRNPLNLLRRKSGFCMSYYIDKITFLSFFITVFFCFYVICEMKRRLSFRSSDKRRCLGKLWIVTSLYTTVSKNLYTIKFFMHLRITNTTELYPMIYKTILFNRVYLSYYHKFVLWKERNKRLLQFYSFIY